MSTQPRTSKARRRNRRKGKMSGVTDCSMAAGHSHAAATIISESEDPATTKTEAPVCKFLEAVAAGATNVANEKSAVVEENCGKLEQISGPEKPTVESVVNLRTIENSTVNNDVSTTNKNVSNPEQPVAQLENSPVTSNVNGNNDAPSVIDNTSKNNETHNIQILAMSKLEQELQKRTQERDMYRKKFEEMDKKIAALQTSYDSKMCGDGDEANLRQTVEQLKSKLIQTSLLLEDRGRVVVNQENQINALNNQVTSLKEVVAITRDLLQIRNMEVKHLQAEVDDMENRISEERTRHNTMLTKMEAAVRLNADLKKEYETQLRLFQDLRGKYEEKVTLLSEEKQALEAAAVTQPVAQ